MKFNPPHCIEAVAVNVLGYIEYLLFITIIKWKKIILCMPDQDKVNFD